MTIGEIILAGQGLIGLAQAVLQIVQMSMIKKLMENMVNGQWLMEQARKWGIYFDKLLLKYANLVYNYFVQILEGTLFTPALIDGIMERLYIIVGLVIFFKLSTLAMKYIASPEAFLDGKAGGEQLIKRILFGSVLIILMPLIFKTALNLQSAIISDNLIGKILLPEEVYKDYQKDKSNTGKKIGMMIASGFFTWNDGIDPGASKDATKVKNQYDKVVKYNDLTYFDDEYINKKVPEDDGEYIISYVPIISTLAIGYYLITLLKYAAEVVMRSFKLAFLQIIAPFSIIKWMLDPADTESLKKWINTTVSTYIMLFLRVLTLWIIAMMAYYLKNGVPTDNGVVSLIQNDSDEILKALIIIGLFAFLKELPKLFSDLFGYNLAENETIAGVANQAVGVVKGLALGKVGLENQRSIMNVGMWSAGLGAAGAGLGAAGKGMDKISEKTKNGKYGKGVQAGIGISHGLGNMGVNLGNAMGSAFSNAITSNFGSSPIAAFGKGANAYTNATYQFDDRVDYSQFDGKDEKEKKAGKAADNAFNNVNQVTNNNTVSSQNSNNIDITSQDTFKQFCESMQSSITQDYSGASVPSETVIRDTIIKAGMDPTNMSRDDVAAVYLTLGAQADGERLAVAQEKLNQTVVNFTNITSQTSDTPPAGAEAPAQTGPKVEVGRPGPPNNT